MNILIIDDDPMFCEPLAWRLEQEGHKVNSCKSVEEVLDVEKKLTVPEPDLILLDIMMPRGEMYSKRETDSGGGTGLRLLQDIYDTNSQIPVIILTVRGDLNLAQLQERFGHGIKDVLVKPILPSEVIEAIKKDFPDTE